MSAAGAETYGCGKQSVSLQGGGLLHCRHTRARLQGHSGRAGRGSEDCGQREDAPQDWLHASRGGAAAGLAAPPHRQPAGVRLCTWVQHCRAPALAGHRAVRQGSTGGGLCPVLPAVLQDDLKRLRTMHPSRWLAAKAGFLPPYSRPVKHLNVMCLYSEESPSECTGGCR